MRIETRIIDKAREADINIKNEPFELFGRMIPKYDGEKWSWTSEKSDETGEMCFPDENYSYDEMSENSTFIGAYDVSDSGEEKCVGLAILQEGFFKYMYLYDLKVNRGYRGKGVGRALLERMKETAREKGYIGIYTIGQDNNLAACLFYIRSGFEIGGLDTKVYGGTSQAEKRDILFYLDF